MSEVIFGQLAPDGAKRDAVHVAVAPVIAGHDMNPGDHVGVNEHGVAVVKVSPEIGIVDPFLTAQVKAGEQFWLFLYQKSVTNMRHHWSHPAFPDKKAKASVVDKTESERWLRQWAQQNDSPPYEELVTACVNSNNDDYLTVYGDASGQIPSELWDHVEVVSGHKIPSRFRARYFSCSC